MANGIGSAEVVEAMGRAGMLGFFGSAGLPLHEVERAVDRIPRALGSSPFGFNLIHSPNEPAMEAQVVDLYLRRGIRRVEASAYLDLTAPLVRYRVRGLARGADGRVTVRNQVIAKASRAEVASRFFAPPPEAILRELFSSGAISAEEMQLAREIPLAQDLTAEADSGGHTDNRPAVVLFPGLVAVARRMEREHGYRVPLRVGAAGGIATPHSVAAAFAMGAAYVLSGSVNQACVEAGTSPLVRRMLAEAGPADVAMAPAADMFEMGVRVQVLKRGTLFAMRAAKLFELYRRHESLDALPEEERSGLEKSLFRAPVAEIWRETCAFFAARDPAQIERAERDPKHKMALVFRWYLGLSSTWANHGDAARQLDFQIWCGPAMGGFNEWVRGTFLEAAENRRVVTVALNLLHGGAVLTRAAALRAQGIALEPGDVDVVPREPAELERSLN